MSGGVGIARCQAARMTEIEACMVQVGRGYGPHAAVVNPIAAQRLSACGRAGFYVLFFIFGTIVEFSL